ncbi:MAG: hypothetical protein LBE83_05645 [Propionibacteriaceae bacterium]|nr:hypothetical protein [Propionibacteriaceae bacterium]
MATWKDGPRYAPAERPMGFVEPSASVSLVGDPPPPPPPAAPLEAPQLFDDPVSAVPLASIVPAPKDTRDPGEAFPMVSTLMTSADPAGMVRLTATEPGGTRPPNRPFHVSASLNTTTASWAPPAAGDRPVVVRRPVRIADLMAAAYPALLITLVVIGLVAIMDYVLAWAGLLFVTFALVPRVHLRVKQTRTIFLVGLGGLATLWFVSLLVDASTANVDLGLGFWTFLVSWCLAIAAIIVQWDGLSRGERPAPKR